MKVTLCILAALLVCALAQNVGDACTSDRDCHDGCCIQSPGTGGMTCHQNGKLNEKCNLDGHAKDVCGCEGGLTCKAPAQHDHHYGVCSHH